MDIVASVVAFGVGSAIAYYTTYKNREFDNSSLAALKEYHEAQEHDRTVEHVPYRAYAYAALALLAFADCAADTLGSHWEQRGRDDGEYVEDWKPTGAQRWRRHEQMRNDRFLPLFAGVLAVDLAVRYSAKRRKRA